MPRVRRRGHKQRAAEQPRTQIEAAGWAAALTDEQLAAQAIQDRPGWQALGMECAAEDEIARRRSARVTPEPKANEVPVCRG